MTRRVLLIAALGLVATLAVGGFALSVRGGGASSPAVSPTWGVFTDAQWHALGSRVGPSMKLVTAMPQGNGRPFAIVSVQHAAHTCFVVVRGVSPSAPICTLAQPVLAFTARERDGLDVVGLARRNVESVVASWGTMTQGTALLPAGTAHAFGSRYIGAPVVLTAHVHGGAVVARLYCASALRGVCGMSAQRRS